MTRYRVRLEADIEAHDDQDAARRARVLRSLIEERYWVVTVRHDGIEECPPGLPDAGG